MGFVPPVHLMHSRRSYESKSFYDSKDIAEILLAKLMETPNIAVKFENVDNLEDFIEQYNFSSLGINSKKAIILFKGEEIFNITNDWDDHEYYKVHHKKDCFSSGRILWHTDFYHFIDELKDEKILDSKDPDAKAIIDVLDEIDDLF